VIGVDYGIGGLLGENWGTLSNSYSTGNVTGNSYLSGLLGYNWGTVSNSYSIGNVTGSHYVGGLAGENLFGIVSNSYYNYDEVLINGENIITIGALFGADFEEWLANDKFLDINARLSQVSGYYEINNVSDFKQLLAFGQDGSLKFILKSDLDLGSDPNFYIPYLAGEFNGDGHKISNLSFNFDFVSQVGLFGYLASDGVHDVGAENVSIIGDGAVGGLVGFNRGTVSDSYATGNVTGNSPVGGLVGDNRGTVSNFVSNSYATGKVTGIENVGGLVGVHHAHNVSNSFWDIETSGQTTPDGGTGNTTAEMQDITTFLDADWDIVLIGDYVDETWYINNGNDYPRLGWQY